MLLLIKVTCTAPYVDLQSLCIHADARMVPVSGTWWHGIDSTGASSFQLAVYFHMHPQPTCPGSLSCSRRFAFSGSKQQIHRTMLHRIFRC